MFLKKTILRSLLPFNPATLNIFSSFSVLFILNFHILAFTSTFDFFNYHIHLGTSFNSIRTLPQLSPTEKLYQRARRDIENFNMESTLPFDPFSQEFTLLLADSTPFHISVPELDEFILYNVQVCINYAAQLGGSLVILIVLLLLTKADKRKSPIVILNSICLALNIIRNVLQCLYFTGPFSETYAYFGQDYSRVPRSAYAISITATVLTFLLLVCVEISLMLQVRVVCVTLRHVYRQAIYAGSGLVALLAIGFRLALCVENSRYIVALTYLTRLNWLESASNITTSISICWFCAVFVTKLVLALNERRKLGLGHFGPMQIIFIMGCQTLVVPGTYYNHLAAPNSVSC